MVTNSRVGQSSEGSLEWLLRAVHGSSLQILVSAWADTLQLHSEHLRVCEFACLNLCKEGGEFLGSCFHGNSMSLSKALALC